MDSPLTALMARPEKYEGLNDPTRLNCFLDDIEVWVGWECQHVDRQLFFSYRACGHGLQGYDAVIVVVAGTYLTGSAKIWWVALRKTPEAPHTWEEFRKAIKRKFVGF